MDFKSLPVIDSGKASRIQTPITLIAAQDDVLFPGRKMLKRAKRIFPSLKESHLIMDSKHVPGKAQNRMMEEIIWDNHELNNLTGNAYAICGPRLSTGKRNKQQIPLYEQPAILAEHSPGIIHHHHDAGFIRNFVRMVW